MALAQDFTYVLIGLRDGRLIKCDLPLANTPTDSITVPAEVLAHQGEVTNLALLKTLASSSRTIAITASTEEQCFKTWIINDNNTTKAKEMHANGLAELRVVRFDMTALLTGTGVGIQDRDVAFGFGDGRIVVFDAWSGVVVDSFLAHGDEVWDIRACGPLLVSSSRDRSIAVHWRSKRLGRIEHVFSYTNGWIVRLKVSPKRIIAMGFDSALQKIDLA